MSEQRRTRELAKRLAPLVEELFQRLFAGTSGPEEASIAVGVLLQIVCDAANKHGYTLVTPEAIVAEIRAAGLHVAFLFPTGTLQ